MHTVVVIALPRFDRDLDPRTDIVASTAAVDPAKSTSRHRRMRAFDLQLAAVNLTTMPKISTSRYHPAWRPHAGAGIGQRSHSTSKGVGGDREPHQVAERIPVRGELLVRYGRGEPAPHLFPGHRAQPGGHGLSPPLWARGRGATDRRRVRAARPAPDLLHSRMVHGAISAGDRPHRRAWA